jgi:hypothetical protein
VVVLQAGRLVTLGGCHLLDGLVVVSVEARKKLVRCSREELCEGHCARPTGAAKSNSSKARHEGRQVVRPGQVLELVISTPRGRV